MRHRIIILYVLLFCAWLSLIARLAFLQVIPNPKLAELHTKKFEKLIKLFPRRGSITDTKGRDLASSILAYSLYADPYLLHQDKVDLKNLSHKLSPWLKTKSHKIEQKLRLKDRRFVWLGRRLEAKLHGPIKNLKLRGLGFVKEPRRLYPNNHLLGQILGFVGSDGKGLEGLEFEYDAILKGEGKKTRVPRDARGRPLIVNGQLLSQPPEGSHLQLTIDLDLQYALEQILSQALEKFNAKKATGVIMEAHTGGVLALAHVPGFNPNKAWRSRPGTRKARALTDALEPGSTFKVFTMAAALKKGILVSKKYFCENGRFKVGNRIIKESSPDKKFQHLNLKDILKNSSNIGSTKVAFDVGAETLFETLKQFGFGHKTGVDFSGENKGILQPLPWRAHLLSNVSFGQGVSATALQMATAYSAVANGGTLYKPYLVKSIHNPDVFSYSPKKVAQVLTPQQAHSLQQMLVHAHAPQAAVKGFRLGGKTGTAQKAKKNGRGYKPGAYVSSYAGFVPGNRPEYVIYISVDEPQKHYYGAVVAAPLFAEIARVIIRQKALPPELPQVAVQQKAPIAKKIQARAQPIQRRIAKHILKGLVPDLKGLGMRELVHNFKGLPVKIKIYGSGQVVKSSPEAQSPIAEGDTLLLYLE